MIWRYKVCLLIIIFGFLLVVSRLFYWQIVKASELSNLGQLQYGNAIKLFPKRGEIRTSDDFPIATNKISYQIFANPKEVKNKEQVSQLLGTLLSVDSASISGSLSLDRVWVPIKNDVDVDTKKKIEELGLKGIGFSEKYSRFYPEASMAATLLGFVGKDDEGNDKGYFGLEGYYNRLLKGVEGVAVSVNDAFGRPILAKMNASSGEIDGSSLVLSIDRSIQYLVEKKIKEGVERFGATSGMVGIMDPKTGNILALANYPSFDQREYWKYSDELYKNPFVSDLYEPGSTFKPLVMSAALDGRLVTPKTQCDICAGPVAIGGYDIHTWNDKYIKNINMIETIQHSDNTGMVFVAQKLGVNGMISSLSKFGIGSNTGIDLQGEVSAPLKPPAYWYPVDLATTGFGQGISVTPLQILSAVGAIANDGKRMEPHVVTTIINSDGNRVNIKPKELDRAISPNAARVMAEIMVNAVNKGEASFARVKGYRIAGKTGTASIPIAGHYDPNQTIASFVGFAPSANPKFVMIVIYNRPTTSIYGAETAAPTFFDIARAVLNYYQVPPTEVEQ